MGFLETLQNIRWSRILLAAMVIVMPIYIFVSFFLVDFEVPWITDPNFKELIVRWIGPVMYAFGWVFMLVIFATRAADTAHEVNASSKIIPLRMRLFYTVNALFLTAIFVFPVVTPIVAIVAFASVGWRLTTFNKEWDSSPKVSAWTYIVMVLFAIPPALLAIVYLPAMWTLAVDFWNDWLFWVNYLYVFSMCLATALTFGSLIYFIRTGASEYEQIQMGAGNRSEQGSFLGVKLFQVLMFAFLLFLYWRQIPILNLFYWVGLIIVIFMSIINLLRRGGGAVQLNRSYFLGYILTAAFFVGELWRYEDALREGLKSVMLVVTAIVYIATFVYKFFTYEETDVF